MLVGVAFLVAAALIAIFDVSTTVSLAIVGLALIILDYAQPNFLKR